MGFLQGYLELQEAVTHLGVIVDQLTNSAYFLLVRTTHLRTQYAKLYLEGIMSLHNASLSIISDRGSQTKSHF